MTRLKRQLDGVERREEQRYRREKRQKDEEEWKVRFEHEMREKRSGRRSKNGSDQLQSTLSTDGDSQCPILIDMHNIMIMIRFTFVPYVSLIIISYHVIYIYMSPHACWFLLLYMSPHALS